VSEPDEQDGQGGQQELPAFQLTAEEIAEFRRLRKEAADRAARDRQALKTAVQERTGPTHFVHLASGEVVKLAGGNLVTHHNGVPVVAAYEMSAEDKAAARAEELATADAALQIGDTR
jgi:hypothetical protein